VIVLFWVLGCRHGGYQLRHELDEGFDEGHCGRSAIRLLPLAVHDLTEDTKRLKNTPSTMMMIWMRHSPTVILNLLPGIPVIRSGETAQGCHFD